MEARKDSIRKVAAVVSIEVLARASVGRFLAQLICDPSRVGVVENRNSAL